MKFGLTPEQYDYILKTVVAPLESKGARVYCFGSRARGDHKAFSDLDLMVETQNDLSREVSLVSEVLSNSNFPIKVDLVEKSQFAKSYLQNYENEKIQFLKTQK